MLTLPILYKLIYAQITAKLIKYTHPHTYTACSVNEQPGKMYE